MNIWIIIGMLFCAIGGYVIGLNRGIETHKYDYDEGYTAGFHNALTEIEVNRPDKLLKYNARELLRQLEDLFDDEEEILDGGEY